MDLSPGSRSDPARLRAGLTTMVESFVILISNIADAAMGNPR
jgi:hypothetical protein